MRPTQMDRLSALQKGHAKLNRGQAVLPTRQVVETRMVRVDSKTVKYVKVTKEGGQDAY